MITLLGAVLLASLLGSLHCAGMCGPFAAFAVFPGQNGGPDRGRLRLHLAYHGGRLASYASLGALAGALGAALDLGGSLLGVQRSAAVLAGVLMVGFGLLAMLRISGWRLPGTGPSQILGRWIRRGHGLALRWSPLRRALTIGALTALLPCGWLYAFVLAAAGTGSPLLGGLTLTAFWLGTVPVLASIGVGVQKLTGWSGHRVQLAAALLVVVLGVLSISNRWDLSLESRAALADPPSDIGEAVERVQALRSEEPPCCQHHD
jgi:sulfite exporter TauE/SafE